MSQDIDRRTLEEFKIQLIPSRWGVYQGSAREKKMTLRC